MSLRFQGIQGLAPHLLEVVFLWNHPPLALAAQELGVHWEGLGVADRIMTAWEVVHFYSSGHEVHRTFVMVIMIRALGRIHRKLQIVGSQTMPLRITIREDPRLQHADDKVYVVVQSRHLHSGRYLLVLRYWLTLRSS